MKNKIEIIASLKSRLTGERFIHSLNVADMAKELAAIYGCDEGKAYYAGLIHDCTKNTPEEKQLKIMRDAGIELTELEMNNKKLWHAISGSAFIQSEYGITDPEIVSAVRYHTTGKADMTLLQKIIYVADFTSAERDYHNVNEIRHYARTDIDRAVFEGADFCIKELEKHGRDIHPDTVAARNYYGKDLTDERS